MLSVYGSRKGHSFLLDAFLRVIKEKPLARMIICGFVYKNDIERVEELVTEKQLERYVHLWGFHNDVEDLIETCDVFC